MDHRQYGQQNGITDYRRPDNRQTYCPISFRAASVWKIVEQLLGHTTATINERYSFLSAFANVCGQPKPTMISLSHWLR
jgi:hypothetical protein